MKPRILLLSITTLSVFFVLSCKKDVVPIDTAITPVNRLAEPANNTQIILDPVNGSSLVFRWTPAYTPDSGVIQYEVVFDKAEGDFSQPVYKILADVTGTQTQASISQKDMNKIAALAGIASSSSGSLKWGVMAYKLTHSVMSSETGTLQITRPAGFAIAPDSLFITGTATEGGEDIANAIPLKKMEEGVFELYTSLQEGTYSLTDRRDATGTSYYVDANGVIREGSTATTVTGAAQSYRLGFDFNVATTEKTAIQSIGLYVSAYNTETAQLTYAGNSTWEVASVPVEFYEFSWGRDDRYKLIMHTADGAEYWGSENADNVPPAGQPASYFYLVPVTGDQWNNTFKFDPSADGHNVKVDVFFKPEASYTHSVTVR